MYGLSVQVDITETVPGDGEGDVCVEGVRVGHGGEGGEGVVVCVLVDRGRDGHVRVTQSVIVCSVTCERI